MSKFTKGKNMKCSIATIHHIHNFGSVFQAYALQQFLEDSGYDTELIDYRPAYYDAGKKKLRTFLGKLLNARAYLVRKHKFENFIKATENLIRKEHESHRFTKYFLGSFDLSGVV